MAKTIEDIIKFCRDNEQTTAQCIRYGESVRNEQTPPANLTAVEKKRIEDAKLKKEGSEPLSLTEKVEKIAKASTLNYFDRAGDKVEVEDLKSMMPNTSTFESPKAFFDSIVSNGLDALARYYQQQSALLYDINKNAGLTGDLSEKYRKSITEAAPILMRMGFSYEEISDYASKLVTESGKFRMISQQTLEESGAVAQAYVGSLSELGTISKSFENIGLGVSDTNKALKEAGKGAITLGLRSQTVTKEIGTNIEKLNSYGFKNGVAGLTEMVKKSVEFKMNMESVFKIAEDVMDPEKALSLTANLQVIGGAIGAFNDPLKMMYMATNDVEGLGDSLIEAASSLATYNEEQGRFGISSLNMRRAREMAQALGMSTQDLTKMAIAGAERFQAFSEIAARGLDLSEEQERFITNLAQMKDGRMVIEIDDEKLRDTLGIDEKGVALENLTESQAKQLIAYQDELRTKTPDEIIRGQATDISNILLMITGIRQTITNRLGQTADVFKEKAIEEIAKKAYESGYELIKGKKPEGEVKDIMGALTSLVNEANKKEYDPSSPIGIKIEEFKKEAADVYGQFSNKNKSKTPKMADGGIVEREGIAKVDKNEVFLGKNTKDDFMNLLKQIDIIAKKSEFGNKEIITNPSITVQNNAPEKPYEININYDELITSFNKLYDKFNSLSGVQNNNDSLLKIIDIKSKNIESENFNTNIMKVLDLMNNNFITQVNKKSEAQKEKLTIENIQPLNDLLNNFATNIFDKFKNISFKDIDKNNILEKINIDIKPSSNSENKEIQTALLYDQLSNLVKNISSEKVIAKETNVSEKKEIQSNHNVTIKHHISSNGSMFDELVRHVVKSPLFQEDFIKSSEEQEGSYLKNIV